MLRQRNEAGLEVSMAERVFVLTALFNLPKKDVMVWAVEVSKED
jgi:hypothetical protein